MVYFYAMTPKESIAIIEAAGGDSEFARLLGIADGVSFRQRVNNWKRRGIPPRVILEHLIVIEALRRKSQVAA